jgi:hypothetical protein
MHPQTPLPLTEIPLEELIDQILLSGKITRVEAAWLATALRQDMLDAEQQVLAQRVFYGLRHGLITVVDWAYIDR